jgi:hypothetical protein
MVTKKTLADERGIILVISLITIALLIGAGAAAIVSVQTDLKISGNLAAGNRAFYSAEAGINHARRELQSRNGTMSFDRVMQSSNGVVIASNASFNGGAYKVTRLEAAMNPDRIRVVSAARGPHNSVSEIEAWFKKNPGRPPKAIITGGDLKISGSPKLIGVCGGAHSNDDMQVLGNPAIQMIDGLTAADVNVAGGVIPEGINIGGAPCVGSAACSNFSDQQPDTNKLDTTEKKQSYEASQSGVEPYDLPRINPADYAPYVAGLGESGNGYLLHDNGTVTSGPGIACEASGLCSGGASVAVPQGWSFTDGTWTVAGTAAADGVFYSEAKVEISGNVGTSSRPWEATIIGRDSIRLSGDVYLRPYPSASLPLQNHLLVTGNDLEISGNLTANYAGGALLAHQQFKITKDSNISGFIIAGDGSPAWVGDPFADSNLGVSLNEISGNPIIDYSCQFGCLGPGCPVPRVTLVGWKQKF